MESRKKMNGTLMIEVTEDSIHTKTDLYNVGFLEKAALIDAFLRAIELDPKDAGEIALLLAIGDAMHEKTVEHGTAEEDE